MLYKQIILKPKYFDLNYLLWRREMNKFINENLLKMNTEEFLSNIKKAFNDVFSNGNIEKINLMNYLSEKKWLSIKKCCLLLTFLQE